MKRIKLRQARTAEITKRRAKDEYSSSRPGIDPREWVKRAKLPKNWKELDLQRLIAKKLRESGYTVKENVSMQLPKGGNAEADIVIYKDGKPQQVLEVKPKLDRNAVIMGTNQARSYTQVLGAIHQPILIGLAPWSDKVYWGGRNAANLSDHNGVGICYLNEDQTWIPPKGGDTGSRSGKDDREDKGGKGGGDRPARGARLKGAAAKVSDFWNNAGIKLPQIPWKFQILISAIIGIWVLVGMIELSASIARSVQQLERSREQEALK